MRRLARKLAFQIVLAVVAARAGAAGVAARPSAGCEKDAFQAGGRLEQTIDVNGMKRSYILDVPSAMKPHQPAPLLLDFHGLGHSAEGVWRVSAFRQLGEREGFITAYPNGEPVHFEHDGKTYDGRGWEVRSIDGNRDLAFVRVLLDRLANDYCIDLARVFVTGFSNGAFLSHVLACTMADRIAAIAPVSGGRIFVACQPPRGVPVLIQHGTLDPLISTVDARAARDTWLETDHCGERQRDGACETYSACRDGAVVEYCEESFEHRWPPQATERIWEFFRQHPLAAAEGKGPPSLALP